MHQRTSKEKILNSVQQTATITATITTTTITTKSSSTTPAAINEQQRSNQKLSLSHKCLNKTQPAARVATSQQQNQQVAKQPKITAAVQQSIRNSCNQRVELGKQNLNANFKTFSQHNSDNHVYNKPSNMFETQSHQQQHQQQQQQQYEHYEQQANGHYSVATTSSVNDRTYMPSIATISGDANDDCNATTVLSLSSSPCSSTDSYDSTLSNSPNSSNSSNCSHNSGNSSNATTSSTTPIGVNLRVTGQCSQGGRKYMEDYFSVAYQQSENAKDLEYAFIGIYDGHGGAEAAIYAKEHLMMEIIKQKQFWSDNDHDVLRAIREGYIATHYAMWRDQENWPKTANGLPSTAGTTATIAFIRREKIYIGHVGDSGIVLGYQNEFEDEWRAKPLTTDHKPESAQERSRIKRSGGKVMVKSGVPRVVWRRPRNPGHVGPIRSTTAVDEIPFLAVARSLGDLWSYNPENREFVVSPDPDVKVVKINPKTFRCLIFGTDGLWNVITPQEAVDKVHERERINQRLQNMHYDTNYENSDMHWTNPSKGLVEDALRTWSAKKMRADNTSVVTVILYPATEQNKFERNEMPTPAMSPMSYGLEYTKMQAELPVYEDNITYKELAQKYLPPEAYRNYDYYESEETGFGQRNSRQAQELIEEVAANEVYPAHINITTTDGKAPVETTESDTDEDEEDDELEDEEDDDDEEEDDEADEDTAEEEPISSLDANVMESHDAHDNTIVANDNVEIEVPEDYYPARSHPSSYDDWHSEMPTFSEDTPSSYADVENAERQPELHANDTSDDNLGKYADIGISFAETFNSLLADQEVTQPQQTNTVQTTTTTYASMQEILQEQACMSEQEGYSLTKLETRQEKQQQQQNKKVQSETLINAASIENASNITETVTNVSSVLTTNDATQTSCYWATTRFQQQIEQLADKQQKLLELNSLLQQEHEEEQQVLLEHLQMTRHQLTQVTSITHQQVAAEADNYLREAEIIQQAIEEHKESSSEPLLLNAKPVLDVKPEGERQPELKLPMKDTNDTCSATPNVDETLIEEYLEDALAAVQINEVSSSNITETSQDCDEEDLSDITLCCSSSTSSTRTTSSSDCESSSVSSASCTTDVIELLEKVEILQPIADIVDMNDKIDMLTEAVAKTIEKKSTPDDCCNNRISLKRSLSKLQGYSSTPSPQKRTRTRSLYPNIPNENQRHSLTASTYSMRHLRSPAAAVAFGNKAAAAAAAAAAAFTLLKNDKRQLRSTTNMQLTNVGASSSSNGNGIDYSKRTLRTRNALTKDLKAKSTYSSSTHPPKQSAAASLNKQFIRQNAAAILSAADVKHRATAKTANATATGIGSGGSAHSYLVSKPTVLNLRSRQVDATSNVPSSAVTLNQRANRNLRSAAAQQTPRHHALGAKLNTITTIKITPTSYSKTTKLQQSGSGSIAVAPPPSPKLINAPPAATRARSMIATRPTQQSMRSAAAVAASNAKGVTLRSQSSGTMSLRNDASHTNHNGCDSSRSTLSTGGRARLNRKR